MSRLTPRGFSQQILHGTRRKRYTERFPIDGIVVRFPVKARKIFLYSRQSNRLHSPLSLLFNVHRRLSSSCKETELWRRLLYFIAVARISKIAPPLSSEPSRRATNRPFANPHARISFTSMFIYERKGISLHTVKAFGGVEVLVHAFLTSTTDGAEWRL